MHQFVERRASRVDLFPVAGAVTHRIENPELDPITVVTEQHGDLGASWLGEQADLGRRLFFGNLEPNLTAPGSGLSCGTCHFDGRNDGLTWLVPAGRRQTPSLAGRVSETAPVTWSDAVPSVAEEARITASVQMAGQGATDEQAEAIAAFVDTTLDENPAAERTDAAARGELLFFSADVGCAACHPPPLYTDLQDHWMFGEATTTPSLVGVAMTPPYLHDGRLQTLREVLEASRDEQMGDTSGLSDAEIDDLLAYLRSI